MMGQVKELETSTDLSIRQKGSWSQPEIAVEITRRVSGSTVTTFYTYPELRPTRWGANAEVGFSSHGFTGFCIVLCHPKSRRLRSHGLCNGA
jgi:hypothetical protein